MPKKTFYNLPEVKRKDFIHETLVEFSKHNYETASINRIIQKLGIARGSVYQYFDNKLDLWLYIKEYAENIKLGYIKSLNRSDYDSFWDYYRELFMKGIDFDLEEPLCSQFLFKVSFKENSADVKPYINSWKKKAREMIGQMIEKEKQNGEFANDVPTEIIAHFLATASLGIAELMEDKYKVNFEENIQLGKPLFGLNKTELSAAANDLINLFEKALK